MDVPRALCVAIATALLVGADGPNLEAVDNQPHATQALRGRVVWMADALRRRFGVDTDADAARAVAALETAAGELHPIVKDFRGRAFHTDPRLHEMELELVVRRFKGSPMLQVIGVYSLKADGKYEVDYWCEICAIPMYEPKLCECCQEPNELRERRVLPSGDAANGKP